MFTPTNIVTDVSQATRASANRSSAEPSGEFGETLSALGQEERSSHDEADYSEQDVAAEEEATPESAGSRTSSRLALSFLQKSGVAASSPAKADIGQSVKATVSVTAETTEIQRVATKSGDAQVVLKASDALGNLTEIPAATGETNDAQAALGTDPLAQRGQKAGTGATTDVMAQMIAASDADALSGTVEALTQDGKTGRTSSHDRKFQSVQEARLSKPEAADGDPDAVSDQAADAAIGAGQATADTQVTTEGDVQNSALAVATLLSGLAATEGVQPQAKTSPRGETGSVRSDKDNKALPGSTVVDGGELLDAAVAKDVLEKSILERSVDADETEKRTFRLTSGQSGRSLDMTIGTDQSGKATFDTSTKASSAETVTVLDSRRFLGFTQSVNGAALTSTIAGNSEWQTAMQSGATLPNDQARAGTTNVVNTLKLQMTPIDLGTVTATLRLVGEELTVHLTVETRAAHQQLSDDSTGILGALRAQGFSVDQVTVSMSAQDSNPQMSGDGQQRSADANTQQGNPQSQKQSSGGSEASIRYGSNETEAGSETRPHSADRAGGTSDIYL